MARLTYGKELSPEERKKIAKTLGGMGELVLSAGTGAIAEPIAGWGGILSGGNADAVEAIKENLTYRPRSDEAYEVLSAAGEAVPDWMKELTRAYGRMGEAAGEVHPALGAAVDTVPAAVGTLIPLAGRAKALGAMVPEGQLNRQAGILRGLSPQMAAESKGVRALQEGGVPEEVWAEHNVAAMPGMQGKFVTEIDDSGASLGEGGTGRLTDLLKHPEMYRSVQPMKYVAEVPVEGFEGAFDPKNLVMGLNRNQTPEQMLSTAIHESQHGVASMTGLPKGTSPGPAYDAAKQEIDAIRKLRQEVFDRSGMDQSMANELYADPNSIFSGVIDTDSEDWKDLVNLNKRMADQYDITNREFSRYQNDMGEALARMAEGRRTMTAGERRESFPFSEQEFKRATGISLSDALRSMQQ